MLDGGTGTDWADYSDKTTAVSVTLAGAANAIVKVSGVAEDTIRNIENVQGGSGNDTLVGDGLANSCSATAATTSCGAAPATTCWTAGPGRRLGRLHRQDGGGVGDADRRDERHA